MTRLTCAEVEPLLGARALDALPQELASQVDDHVRGCADHAETLAELHRTAAVLPLMVDDREPSPALRERIIDLVRRETAGSEPQDERRQPVRSTNRQRNVFQRFRPAATRLMLAASLVLALGIGYLVGIRTQPELRTVQLHGNQLAPEAEGTLVYAPGQSSAVLTVSGLPALKAGQVYEAWLIRNNAPIDIGVANTDRRLVLRISRDPTSYQVVAITIEPGEQAQPTTNPVIAANVS
jgi:hypothetical protein